MTPTPRKTCLLFFTLNIGSANINYNNLHLGPHGSCILLHNKPQDPAPVAWNQIFNASFTLQRGRFLQMVCLFPCSKHRLTYVVAKGSQVTRGQTPVSKSCLSTTELYLLLFNWKKGIIWWIPHPWHTHTPTPKRKNFWTSHERSYKELKNLYTFCCYRKMGNKKSSLFLFLIMFPK